jgi:hypothetical protein
LAGYVHVIAAALGLAVLFTTVPVLYTALKLVGAVYLIWLGIKMFRTDATPTALPGKMPEKSARKAFWESATVEILNPKTAIFYLAFLPQFADPMASMAIWAQLLILGTIVNVVFFQRRRPVRPARRPHDRLPKTIPRHHTHYAAAGRGNFGWTWPEFGLQQIITSALSRSVPSRCPISARPFRRRHWPRGPASWLRP